MPSRRGKDPRPPKPPRPSPARYRIELKPRALRDLEALERRDRVRMVRKIDALATNPRPRGVGKLAGEDGILRVRIGEFRILYRIEDAALLVLIIRVGHRREVYR